MLAAGTEIVDTEFCIILTSSKENIVTSRRSRKFCTYGICECRHTINIVSNTLNQIAFCIGESHCRTEMICVVIIRFITTSHLQSLINIITIKIRGGKFVAIVFLDHLVTYIIIVDVILRNATTEGIVLESDSIVIGRYHTIIEVVNVSVLVIIEQIAVSVILRSERQTASDGGVGIHVVGSVVGGYAILYCLHAVAKQIKLISLIHRRATLERNQL